MDYKLEDLKRPFPQDAIEWRVMQARKGAKGVWAKCLAYVTNRAIQDRLDEVFGPGNWKNDYHEAPGGGILCGIGVYFGADRGWVWKWDASGQTDIEAIKGGHSSAMKRSAVQWGIGRYLYRLEEGWATVYEVNSRKGRFYQGESKKTGTPAFRWDPPVMPDWATLKGDSTAPTGVDDLGSDDAHTEQPTQQQPSVPTEEEKLERKGYIDEIASYLGDQKVFSDDERKAFGDLMRGDNPPKTPALKAMVAKYRRNWESRQAEAAKKAMSGQQMPDDEIY